MKNKYSICRRIIAKEESDGIWHCSECKKVCETMDYYNTTETLLLTEIRDLLKEVLGAINSRE
ncbi:MAG: hypothetical protein QMD86_02880 [Patescibacteria group bacterium]|nr:hypothetical protein [Patescibacteria group bacterium]